MAAPVHHEVRQSGRRELSVFLLAYLTYFGVRAITEGRVDKAFHNAAELIHLERSLGIDLEHTVQTVVTGSRALTDAANAVYIYGHWPVLIGAGLLLFRFRRAHYCTLRDACLISGLIGLVIFALFPVAPPRLTDLPVVDTVTKNSPGYRQIFPASLVNEYAAMPSFHAGWNLLVGIIVFQATTNVVLRSFAALMPAAMMFAVVATANHFILDVVIGAAIVLVSLWLAQKLERRRWAPRLKPGVERQHADIQEEPALGVSDRPPSRERPAAAAGG